MESMTRRNVKVNSPISPSNDRIGSLPITHSADTSPSSTKQRSRIHHKRAHSWLFSEDRKLWIRVLLFSLFFWQRHALRRQACRYCVDYLAWKADTVEGSIWRGTLPRHLWKQQNDFIYKPKIDLVISHCDLPLDWIFQWAGPVRLDKITILSKCGKPVVGAPSNAKIINLPNLGRCDQSYAHFLVNHYDDYAEYDGSDDQKDKFIVFMKDNDNMNRDIMSRHRSMPEMIAISQSMGFACQEEQIWGYSQNDFFKICHPSAYMNWTAMAPYSRESYMRLPRDDNSDFASRNGKNLQEYIHNLAIPEPESGIAPLCFGGNFMFHAKNIWQHPKDLWERIEKSLSRGNNIAEGHYMERLWAHLLSPPLSADTVREILKQSDSSCQIEILGLGVLSK